MNATTAHPLTSRADLGLTVLRIGLGIVFLMHGWQKLFQMGIPGVSGFFDTVGIPAPMLVASAIIALELIGGAALLIGLFTRWVALAFAAEMLVAALLVHLPGGFFAPDGIEMVLLPLAGSIALALAGPGAYALGRIIAPQRPHMTTSSRTSDALVPAGHA